MAQQQDLRFQRGPRSKNPISAHQISLQSSLIEQMIHAIRCLSPTVLGLRQRQMLPRRQLFTYIPLAHIKPIVCPRCGEKARAVWHSPLPAG
jgi:hypothetical protein